MKRGPTSAASGTSLRRQNPVACSVFSLSAPAKSKADDR